MTEHDFAKYPELTNPQLQEMPFSSPHVQITDDFYAKVVKIHDGDTITVETDFRDFKFPIRFLDIDAPELNTGTPGEKARDYVKARLLNEQVQIRIDQKNRVDKYGRLLGRIFHRGTDVGTDELMLGLASPFNRRREGEIPSFNKELRIEKWL